MMLVWRNSLSYELQLTAAIAKSRPVNTITTAAEECGQLQRGLPAFSLDTPPFRQFATLSHA